MSASLVPNAQAGKSVFVVDSWPVLEWAYCNEPVVITFREYLDAATQGKIRLLISRINLGEIRYNFFNKKKRGEIPDLDLDLSDFPWEIISVDDALVDEAADMKTVYPISYADCFVAALAMRHNAPVLTGDPDFQKLAALGVLRIEWLGA